MNRIFCAKLLRVLLGLHLGGLAFSRLEVKFAFNILIENAIASGTTAAHMHPIARHYLKSNHHRFGGLLLLCFLRFSGLLRADSEGYHCKKTVADIPNSFFISATPYLSSI
jgi:hypothetical protein